MDGVSRYRTERDATAKAEWPDSAADTPGRPASTRQTGREQGANWGSVAASLADDITSIISGRDGPAEPQSNPPVLGGRIGLPRVAKATVPPHWFSVGGPLKPALGLSGALRLPHPGTNILFLIFFQLCEDAVWIFQNGIS